jgi:hypothetical protein
MANDTERSSGVPTWVWAAAGSLATIAFLVWISMAAQPAQIVAVTEEDTTAAAPELTGEVVTPAALAADTDTLQDRDLLLQNVPVAATMGQQAFWIDLPNQTPYLIKLGEQLTAAGVTFQSGDTVDIAGRIQPMTDSVISAWLSAGAITQNQEAEARFATSFLQATNVRPAQQ